MYYSFSSYWSPCKLNFKIKAQYFFIQKRFCSVFNLIPLLHFKSSLIVHYPSQYGYMGRVSFHLLEQN